MIDVRKRIIEVLEQGHLMSLGTVDEGGVWVADVIYIFDDDLNIYWMSDPECRHSKAIEKNNKVSGSITISNKSKENNFGVQFSGKTQKLEGMRFDLAIKHLSKRGYQIPSKPLNILDGDYWYQLRLDFIDLVDEKNFGFDKKKLDLS